MTKRFRLHPESNQWIWDTEAKTRKHRVYSSIDAKELIDVLNELNDENKELQRENEQYKKNSISLKQLYKILEENKEHFLSLAECFSEKLFIKTIFRNIDDSIESREVLE